MTHFERACAAAVALAFLGATLLGQAPADPEAALAEAVFEVQAGVLTVYDRQGQVIRTIGDRAIYLSPAFSPDGQRVAVTRREAAGSSDIWVLDVATGVGTRITDDSATDRAPVWSPDGRQIIYASDADGPPGLYRKAADGTGPAELLYQHAGRLFPTDWSPDGRSFTFYDGESTSALPLAGTTRSDREPEVILSGPSGGGRFSPDGRWIAYTALEGGRREVWVGSVGAVTADGGAQAGGPWRISSQGGLCVCSWRGDGRELYYLALDGGLMAVELGAGPPFTSLRERRLFQAPDVAIGDVRFSTNRASISADGERFLFDVRPKPRGSRAPRQITVLDRGGRLVRTLGEPGNYRQPMLSPDGSRVAAFLDGEIQVFDVTTGRRVQVTSSAHLALYQSSPVWSPDGREIAFFSFRDDWGGLYRVASDAQRGEKQLYRHELGVDIPLTDWSADGRFLAFSAGGVLWAVAADGESPEPVERRRAVELLREAYQMYGARFSPDSRFVAYASDESGRNEIYVRPFDPSRVSLGPETWQVSTSGGLGLVQWRSDGQELYYLAADGAVMAVDVTTTPGFAAGVSRRLFQVPPTFELEGVFEREGTNTVECSCAGAGCEQASISRSGERFVFAAPVPPEERTTVAVAPDVLAQYTGTYVETDRTQFDWVVRLENGQLTVQRTGQALAPLSAESDTRFFLTATNGDFEFARDDAGEVKYLFVYRGGAPFQAVRK